MPSTTYLKVLWTNYMPSDVLRPFHMHCTSGETAYFDVPEYISDGIAFTFLELTISKQAPQMICVNCLCAQA